MREILSDLVAEQQSLDQYLQRIQLRDWKLPTAAKGWTIQDTISHLADSEDLAADALVGGDRLRQLGPNQAMEAASRRAVVRGRGMRHQDVIEWWRGGRAKVVEPLSRMRTSDRVEWLHGSMAAQTFATVRLMETWAHGLDIYVATGTEVEDTARIRHVAWLAWKTLPYAFKAADQDYSPVRVEVMGPGYAKWVFGPGDTDEVVKGPAGEWARLAVQRLPLSSAKGLQARGSVAETALRVVRAYL
ncbi:MAG: maleylpyruvate isomerase family mycothiol-dependent enzyme [Acidimicrobiia bacterium]